MDSALQNATIAPPRPLPRSELRDKLDTAYLSSPAGVHAQLEALRIATGEHIAGSKSEATIRAYATGFGAFELWCHRYELSALPAAPDTVACYLTALAARDAAVATLRTRIVAISQAHKAAGYPPPAQSETVRRTMAGIARSKGTRQRQVAPLRTDALKALLAATPEEEVIGVRDRAILLIGFAGGFRRSELAALDAEDLNFVESGVDILIRRSKTDQEGAGRTIGIAGGRHEETDPVLALRRWLTVSGVTTGPLFLRIRPNSRPDTRRQRFPAGTTTARRLSAQGIARVVQRAAARAGLDPAQFAGHSLRSGFATEAAAQGASELAIMRQTGHRSLAMVRRYIRDGDRYRDNASTYLGL